jgi:hypothetical protein
MTADSKKTRCESGGKVEKQAAEQFLTLLAEGADAFTFQTFDDNKQRKDSSLARLLHGTLDQHFDELCRLNAMGAGIFVPVNETDLKGRTKANIVNVRAVFQEADRQGIPVPSLEPHIVVQTSQGKFHRYWLTHEHEAALREYDGVMRTMVDQYGSDPNARDLARVLRLPGFLHMKDAANPFLVCIVEASQAQPYTWEQITAVIPPLPASESTKPQGAQGSFGKDHWRVLSAVKALNSDCEYGVWLAVGMALHHGASGGLTGFIFWDDWSAQGNSYRDGETKYKWSTFGKGNGAQLTLATLFHHAAQNGWEWDQQHKLSVLPEAVCFVVKAIEEAGVDKSTILSEEVIAALKLIRSCDPRAFESLRMRIKVECPEVRMSALDDFVKGSSGGNDFQSLSDMLVQLACERCELWHDPEGRGYATFEQEHQGSTHKEHWEISSTGFTDWIAMLAYTELGKAPSKETLTTVKNALNGEARFDGYEHNVFRRVGKVESEYWIDLCNDHWQAVCVTAVGWRVSDASSVRFVRTKAMQALPGPQRGGSYEPLWPLLNIPSEDHMLVLAWILECYRCDTPYPVLELTGEQGSAKSSTQTALRSIVDPNQVMLRGRPKTVEDVYVSAKNNHLLSFENLSNITNDMSDALCTVATGGGTAGRTLYTNTEETILEAHNPVVLNGIGAVVLRQDLLDRTISIGLPTIVQRRTEKDMKEGIEIRLSSIFGGLLTLFSQSLERLPSVEIAAEELPRMADFAKLGEAMSSALGYSPRHWLAMYSDHRKNAVRRTIDSSPVAVECLKFVAQGGTHTGTVKDLLEKLNGLHTTLLEHKENWPRSPRGLADILRRVAPSMRLLGVHLSVNDKHRDGVHCSLWRIPEATLS